MINRANAFNKEKQHINFVVNFNLMPFHTHGIISIISINIVESDLNND